MWINEKGANSVKMSQTNNCQPTVQGYGLVFISLPSLYIQVCTRQGVYLYNQLEVLSPPMDAVCTTNIWHTSSLYQSLSAIMESECYDPNCQTDYGYAVLRTCIIFFITVHKKRCSGANRCQLTWSPKCEYLVYSHFRHHLLHLTRNTWHVTCDI